MRMKSGQRPADRPEGLSVIVPVHGGRLALLARLLSSLEGSAARMSEPWECLVVDGSPEPEASAVARLCAEHGAVYLSGPSTPAGKRNLGARTARYAALLFVDSDCIASEDLLAAHLRALRSAPPEVAGVVGLTVFTGRASLAWQAAERSRLWAAFGWPRRFARVLWGATVNHSVRASAFEEVGGFEEDRWIVSGGEDAALGVRLADAGRRLVTCPEAMVFHGREHVGPLQMLTKYFMYGQAESFLCSRFPARTRRSVSPLLVAAAGALAGSGGLAAAGRPGRERLGLLAAALGGLALVDAWRVHGRNQRRMGVGGSGAPAGPGRTRGLLLDLASVPLGWAYDAGAAAGALRRGRPELAWRRFQYMGSTEFVPRQPPDRGPEPGPGPAPAPVEAGRS